MATIAIALPLVPGKTEEWKRFTEEIKGPRRRDYADFHNRVGLTRENWYLQHTPQGDMVVVYLEGDLPGAFQALAQSDHPFDHWLIERWLDTEGVDFSKPLP